MNDPQSEDDVIGLGKLREKLESEGYPSVDLEGWRAKKSVGGWWFRAPGRPDLIYSIAGADRHYKATHDPQLSAALVVAAQPVTAKRRAESFDDEETLDMLRAKAFRNATVDASSDDDGSSDDDDDSSDDDGKPSNVSAPPTPCAPAPFVMPPSPPPRPRPAPFNDSSNLNPNSPPA